MGHPRRARGSTSPIRARAFRMFGDYDFQFMIGELAVGAQFTLPHIHVLVNNDCFGRIRHPQRGFNMDDCVQLSFDNVNSPRSTATALTMSATALTMLNFSKDWVAGRFAPSSPRITPPPRSSRQRSSWTPTACRSSWSGSPACPRSADRCDHRVRGVGRGRQVRTSTLRLTDPRGLLGRRWEHMTGNTTTSVGE